MTVQILMQVNNKTGETNLFLLRPDTQNIDDFLVNWTDSKIVRGKAVVIADLAELDKVLLETEFRAMTNAEEVVR